MNVTITHVIATLSIVACFGAWTVLAILLGFWMGYKRSRQEAFESMLDDMEPQEGGGRDAADLQRGESDQSDGQDAPFDTLGLGEDRPVVNHSM